ncbi:LamG-like jellyroll fold domain-containing protein (plasmid) [Streptomyces sp. CWNU-52B]|uniref:LamG-like jellyroll fold domain-containing protein n=1 Tax=unclassified Streptomyces TaxID=2593676 RepID=UPI0039C0D358
MAYLIEMGWGGLIQYPFSITWTDISRYVDMVQGITITRGGSDELSETQPGTASLRLDNQDGRFTPGYSGSPYFPFVRRNAPIRISVALIPQRTGAAPYPVAMLGDDFDDDQVGPLWPASYGGVTETGGRARVPTTPGVFSGLQTARQWTLPGSQLTAKLAAVPALNGSSAADGGMWLNGVTAGTRLGWMYDAVTGQISCQSQTGYYDAGAVAAPYNALDYAWLRVRETAGTTYWELSGDGVYWTVVRSLATPGWVSSQTLVVDFTGTRTGGTAGFFEWDLVGATVRPRFWGTVNEFPVDFTGLASHVSISATDLFKRLNKHPSLRSMLSEEILSVTAPFTNELITTGPMVYYPLTEESGTISAGDIGGLGAPALAIAQAGSGGTIDMSAVAGPPETGDQAPTFTPVSATVGKWLSADLGPQFEDPLMTQYLTVEAWFRTTTTGRAIFAMQTPDRTAQHVLSIAAGGGLQIEFTVEGAALVAVPIPGTSALADGAWHHLVYDQREVSVWIDGVLKSTGFPVYRWFNERIIHIGGYRSTRLWSGSIAHVAIYSSVYWSVGPVIAASHYQAGATGYAGEAADVRVERLARYAGVRSVTVWGSTHDPIASQGPGGSQVMARLREVESTESARLFAERDWYGLAYQSRDVRYNPDPASETFTIAYADTETGDFSLADDDQKLVNVIEASRPGGATQRVTAPQSIYAFGVYDPGALQILKTNDNSVLDAAYWRVSRYANPDPELREVGIEAATLPGYLDILDADISSYFSVTGLPAQAPSATARVTVEGYTETLKEQSHLIRFHTSASITDSVWVLDDPVYSVLDVSTRLAY